MVLLITILLFWHPPEAGDAQIAKRVRAQQLLQQTLNERPALSLSEYLRRLEKVISFDRKFAEAYYRLGLARQEEDTFRSRMLGAEALRRAIELAPANLEYRYALARLQSARGFDGEAKQQYKQIMKLAPAEARPYYELALFEEKDMLHYREMVSLHEEAVISFHEFAQKDFEETERLLRTAVTLDPAMVEAQQRLAALYFEAARFEDMLSVLQNALAHQNKAQAATPENASPVFVDLYLWLGLAHSRLHDSEAAQKDYAQALAAMSPEQRAFFNSLAPVLPPEAREAYMNLDSLARRAEEQYFWNTRDPMFLTPVNERLLEHFSRLAYANLRYSDPRRGIEGWKTDRGQVLIRFGFPQQRVRTRADLGTTPTGRVTLNASKEVWEYGDFHMIFDDRFLNGNYSFAWSQDPEADGKVLFERQIERETERFDFPHGGKPLVLPQVIAQFRSRESSDSTLLEIYYGLPGEDLQPADTLENRRHYQLGRGFFLCDSSWTPIHSWRQNRNLVAAEQAIEPQKFLIERWPLLAPSGAYNFSFETMDRESRHSGVVRDTITIADFSGDSLRLSSLLLADAIEAASDELAAYNKGEVSILPSLSRQFRLNSPVYVYYEIYNLARGADGVTNFRVASTVEMEQEGKGAVANVVSSVGRLFGLGKQHVAVTSSFESRGEKTQENLHHGIQVMGAQPGTYRLTIAVFDLNSGQRTSGSLQFQIIAP